MEAQQKTEQAKSQQKIQEVQQEQQHQAQQNELDRENKIQVAMIAASAKDTDHNNDGKTDNK